ncbi:MULTISPECIES: SusC/RagA family TonB-linked outer membrane protein [unclassified Chryseobacterium]|uniref:SusC/RagA family TonB-linked outer membrane protein n=1 Tax=unclassified Chryseobacterium TaxID=2593645 RepID=UPI0021E582B9|nr:MULTISPECIES: SusC/RagA family TonB-linked outer membrane protein [unclassified Chryseobacterium]MEA1849634.1 SusC/RagA family TonB-linked outer membrane protein [Chryseobacterium sp. MHB01]
MNGKLKVLSAGVLFFIGGQLTMAQSTKKVTDTVPRTSDIEEVVVLGYSKTQTKPLNSTATVTISGERLENRPNVSFLQSMQGEVAGLSVSSTSGSPGSAKMDLIIRGVSSITSQSDPLYVIDGMISNATQFRNLNPNDIESSSVLKDAAATSIYGNRGANGVVIINTKRGRYGSRFDISYNTTIGTSFLPQTKYDMASSQELLTIQNRAGIGMGAGMTPQEIANYGINTNWRKQFFRTGITQSHDVQISAGGQNLSNYTSVGYMQQDGIVPTTDFQRFTLRNNLMGKSKDNRFNYSVNIGLGYSRRHQLEEETRTDITSNVIQNPLLGSIVGLPTLAPGLYANGQDLLNNIGSDFSNGNNVYVLQDILKGTLPNKLTETSIITNASVSYKLTDDLTVSNRTGVDYKYNQRIFARAPWSYLALVVANSNGTEFGGVEDNIKSTDFTISSITNLNYKKAFGDHTFEVGAYLDYMKVHYEATSLRQNGLNPLNWSFGAGTGWVAFNPATPNIYNPSNSASKITAGALAYFGTFDYDYASKYGVSGTVRRDGSYRFVGDNKWATFWSVAGRWNIDKENFMQGSNIDMLKLRASYGTNGNANVVAATYGSNPLLVGTNLVRDTNTIGLGYNNVNAVYYTGTIANPDIQWEEISQFNVGLDYMFLNRRLEGSVDYYKKMTDKLFNPINISAITSLYSINGNNGKLQNEGVEFSVKYHLLRNSDFKLSVYANTAYNKSKFTDLLKDDTTGSLRNVVGGQLSEWYMVPYVGVNQSNGNLLFLDINGNVTETPDINRDARATGKNYLPKWIGGFGVNSSYKGFTLDVHFSYQQGAYKYDNQLDYVYDATTVDGYNVSRDLLNAWTATNTNTNVPSLFATNFAYNGNSDRFLKDASFVRLKNVVLGYKVPSEMFTNSGIRGVRVFLQAENLLTLTKWKGFDPEPTFATSTSVYPNMKTVSLGANIDF